MSGRQYHRIPSHYAGGGINLMDLTGLKTEVPSGMAHPLASRTSRKILAFTKAMNYNWAVFWITNYREIHKGASWV